MALPVGQECGHFGGAGPGEGDAGTAVAVVVDDRLGAAVLGFQADLGAGGAEADLVGEDRGRGQGGEHRGRAGEDRVGGGRVWGQVPGAVVGCAADDDVVAAGDDV